MANKSEKAIDGSSQEFYELSSLKKDSSIPNTDRILTKRKYNDENYDSALTDESHQHRSKRLTNKKCTFKNGSSNPKKTTSPVSFKLNELSNPEKATFFLPSTSQLTPKSPLSVLQPELQGDSSSFLSKNRIISLYDKEDQLKWITEPKGTNDIGYYHVLIEQRFKALQDTWAENNQLKKEIGQLQKENELIEPLFQKVIDLRELLFASEDPGT